MVALALPAPSHSDHCHTQRRSLPLLHTADVLPVPPIWCRAPCALSVLGLPGSPPPALRSPSWNRRGDRIVPILVEVHPEQNLYFSVIPLRSCERCLRLRAWPHTEPLPPEGEALWWLVRPSLVCLLLRDCAPHLWRPIRWSECAPPPRPPPRCHGGRRGQLVAVVSCPPTLAAICIGQISPEETMV